MFALNSEKRTGVHRVTRIANSRERSRIDAAPLMACILALGVACSSAATNIFTPHYVANLRQVTSVAMSPDGQHVAYTVSVPRKPNVDDDGEPWVELWVAGAHEGTPRPFITGKVDVGGVRWSADSQHIGFLAKRGDDKKKSLYLIPLGGGEARKAAELESDISHYSLAPDGRRAALVATEPESEAKKKLKEKGFKQEVYEEDWREAKIWLATLFEQESKPKALALEGHVHQVHWNPVDERLLAVVTPTPSVDDSLMRKRVRVIDGQSGAVLARIENPGKLGQVAWSPDGRRIAMISAADINDPDAGRLMVADATGGRLRDLLPNFEGQVTQIEWASPDTVACVAAVGVQTIFARIGVGESAKIGEPLIGPSGPILAALGMSSNAVNAAFAAHSPAHPAELFTWSEGDSAPKRRTDSNPGLDKMRFAKQEVIRHRARDGLQLEGLLIRPLDDEPGKKYPLVLVVHGGPEAHVSNGWLTSYSQPGQIAAARGMAVFYPNYRGSTGRGVAFTKLGQGDAAGKEFDDLLDAVDHLIEIGLVDRDKVGVTGGSYGGYATAWCSTRYSERFAAGVMFIGISDKVSKVGTTDIPDEEFYVHALKRPWEDWQFLLERSPIFHAQNSRTPLLILHGKDDPRVHVSQSLELYRHLKMHNQAPVRLVLYPGEQHGNRKAAARLDYSLRQLQWMEHYLKGDGGPIPELEIDYTDPNAPEDKD